MGCTSCPQEAQPFFVCAHIASKPVNQYMRGSLHFDFSMQPRYRVVLTARPTTAVAVAVVRSKRQKIVWRTPLLIHTQIISCPNPCITRIDGGQGSLSLCMTADIGKLRHGDELWPDIASRSRHAVDINLRAQRLGKLDPCMICVIGKYMLRGSYTHRTHSRYQPFSSSQNRKLYAIRPLLASAA